MSQKSHHEHRQRHTDLLTPTRMRYTYGMLLDKFHFDLEQQYFNQKRWLLNRLVTGPGVVCGMDVQPTDHGKSIVVTPGLAIDRCGREIVIVEQSSPVVLPYHEPGGKQYSKQEDAAGQQQHSGQHEHSDQYSTHTEHYHQHHCEEEYAHVLLCYHECESDPVPVMAGNCETEEVCVPSTIREQYEIKIRDGKAPERRSSFTDIIEGGRINYGALVEYVIKGCRSLPDDCCIPLANVRMRKKGERYEPDDIDPNVRPIVFTNRMLYELIQSLIGSDTDNY
jgi:hypothetical protein